MYGHYTRLAGLTSDMCGHVSMCDMCEHAWTCVDITSGSKVSLGCCEASGVRRCAMPKTLPGCTRCRPSATHEGVCSANKTFVPLRLFARMANKTLLFARLWLPSLMLLLLPRLGLCSTVNTPQSSCHESAYDTVDHNRQYG